MSQQNEPECHAETANTRRSRWWFGTAQEGTALFEWFTSFDQTGSAISNLIGVFGQCEKGSNVHCHVLMHFKPGKEYRFMKLRWPGAHWLVPKYPRKCFEYCQKGVGGFPHEHGDTFLEGSRRVWGDAPRADRKSERGRRTDIEDAVAAAGAGEPATHFIKRVRSAGAWMMYKEACNLLTRRDAGPRVCIWFWGSTGAGKSAAASTFPGPIARLDARGRWCQTPWAIGFQTLQIDDIADGFEYRELLRLADRYEMEVPIKGSFMAHTAEYVIVTSDRLPRHLKDARGRELLNNEVAQLERRFDIIELPSDDIWCFCSYAAARGLAVDTSGCGCTGPNWGGRQHRVLQPVRVGRVAGSDSSILLTGRGTGAGRDVTFAAGAGTAERGGVDADLPPGAGDQPLHHGATPRA